MHCILHMNHVNDFVIGTYTKQLTVCPIKTSSQELGLSVVEQLAFTVTSTLDKDSGDKRMLL